MSIPNILTFVPGERVKLTGDELLPRVVLPSGSAVLLLGYGDRGEKPTLEERNAIGEEMVARWNARVSFEGVATHRLPKGVTIVPFRDGKFAVSQRIDAGGRLAKWQFPGGHVERGEAPLDAARRELREETGLDLPDDRFAFIGKTAPIVGYKGELYVGFRFGVVLEPGEEIEHTEPQKNSPWRWVDSEELLKLEMLQETIPYALAFALQRHEESVATQRPLARMLTRLTEKVARANAIQHSGGEVSDEDWSELYDLANEAKALLQEQAPAVR